MYRCKKLLFTLTGIMIISLAGCKKAEADTTKVTSLEHKVLANVITSPPVPTKEPEKEDLLPEEKEPSKVPDAVTPAEPTKGANEVDGMKFTPVNDTVKIIASKCNIRTKPSKNSKVVTLAKAGDKFTRTGIGDGEWDQLQYQGETVYAFNQYLQKVEGSDKVSIEAGLRELAAAD